MTGSCKRRRILQLERRLVMHQAEFAARILEMQQTLYRVTYSYLSQETDREDAVQ